MTNLPDGVRTIDIPGNRPADDEWRTALEYASDAVADDNRISAGEADYLYGKLADMGVGELMRWLCPTDKMIEDALVDYREACNERV